VIDDVSDIRTSYDPIQAEEQECRAWLDLLLR